MKIAYTNAELHVGNGISFLGTLITENGRILETQEGIPSADPLDTVDQVVDLSGKIVIPGLVDVHTHGRAGFDFNEASSEELREMARSYVQSGVTALMPTLASAPFSELCDAADRIRAAGTKDSEDTDSIRCFMGIHLEGRYLNPEKRGAHALELLAPLDSNELATLIPHLGSAFHVSCALELDTDGSFLKIVLDAGGTAGLAHTSASYADAMNAVTNGASSFTHTFNAMPPLHHRDGGAVAAAFLSDAYAELIVDGIHVSPEMVRLAYRCKGKDRLVLITDSMQATGCCDGVYSIAGLKCIVRDGKALTEEGKLAGSTLSLIDGMRNLMRFCDISLDEALPTVTANPAKLIGAFDRIGTLEKGKYADFLVLPKDFMSGKQPIERVILTGREFA